MQQLPDFALLFEEHKLMVLNLALQYTQNLQDAEEITQDVFVKVHEKLHTFNHKSTLKTWIYRITIHQSLDFIKARDRKKRSIFSRLSPIEINSSENQSVEMNHPGIIMEDREAAERIFMALNQLPDQQKTALILVKIEQHPIEKAAEIMEINRKALESLIHRAKANLQKILNKRIK